MSARTQHALLLLHHHRPADAEQELRAHLTQEPEDTAAMALLSMAQTMQGEHVQAAHTARAIILLQPDDAIGHYHLARALLHGKETGDALDAAREAVRLDPEDAEHHAMVAYAHHLRNEHREALEAADRGLAVDPENLTCLNIRSAELAHAKRFGEADAATAKMLELDPENAHSHASTGWSYLRRGDHGRAMEHFREALRREPGMDYARQGMMEALKARYLPYRIWLRYVFWVSNLKPGVQTGFIIGIWVLARILSGMADLHPVLGLISGPLLVLYMLFAFSTWVIKPLTDLLLRLNPFGRVLLDRDERITSNFTAAALGLAVIGGLGLLFTGHAPFLTLIGTGLLMMVPLATMRNSAKPAIRRFRMGYAIVLTVLAVLGIAIAFSGGPVLNTAAMAFGVGALLYQWITALFVR